MIYLALLLLFANLILGAQSIRGRELRISDHPVLLRLRYVGAGMLIALLITGYEWEEGGLAGWVCVGVLAVSTARIPRREP